MNIEYILGHHTITTQ